jgi:GT2 family glycosyltransferase
VSSVIAPPEKSGSVLVVVVSTNDGSWLPKCFEALQHAVPDSRFRTLLIANACEDASTELARDAKVPIEVLKTPRKCGFAEANNLGVRLAIERGYDFVFMLNPDTMVHPEAIRTLREFLEARPDYGIAGSRQVRYEASGWEEPNQWTTETLADAANQGNVPRPVGRWSVVEHNYVQGAALMLRTELVRKIGLLDPVYETFYEETDLCRRCLLTGAKVAIVLESRVKHYEGGNWRRSPADHIRRDRLLLRNQYIYFLSDQHQPLAILAQGASLFRSHLNIIRRGEMRIRLGFQHYPHVLAGFVRRIPEIAKMRKRNRSIRDGGEVSGDSWAIGRPVNAELVVETRGSR